MTIVSTNRTISSSSTVLERPPNDVSLISSSASSSVTTVSVCVDQCSHKPSSCCTRKSYWPVESVNRTFTSPTLFAVIGDTQEAKIEFVRSKLETLRNVPQKKQAVLIISLAGIKVTSVDRKTIHMAHALKRISYATTDPTHAQFAFLAREPKSPFSLQYCHVFRTESPETAIEVNAIVGESFRSAYLLKMQDEEEKMQRQDDSNEGVAHWATNESEPFAAIRCNGASNEKFLRQNGALDESFCGGANGSALLFASSNGARHDCSADINSLAKSSDVCLNSTPSAFETRNTVSEQSNVECSFIDDEVNALADEDELPSSFSLSSSLSPIQRKQSHDKHPCAQSNCTRVEVNGGRLSLSSSPHARSSRSSSFVSSECHVIESTVKTTLMPTTSPSMCGEQRPSKPFANGFAHCPSAKAIVSASLGPPPDSPLPARIVNPFESLIQLQAESQLAARFQQQNLLPPMKSQSSSSLLPHLLSDINFGRLRPKKKDGQYASSVRPASFQALEHSSLMRASISSGALTNGVVARHSCYPRNGFAVIDECSSASTNELAIMTCQLKSTKLLPTETEASKTKGGNIFRRFFGRIKSSTSMTIPSANCGSSPTKASASNGVSLTNVRPMAASSSRQESSAVNLKRLSFAQPSATAVPLPLRNQPQRHSIIENIASIAKSAAHRKSSESGSVGSRISGGFCPSSSAHYQRPRPLSEYHASSPLVTSSAFAVKADATPGSILMTKQPHESLLDNTFSSEDGFTRISNGISSKSCHSSLVPNLSSNGTVVTENGSSIVTVGGNHSETTSDLPKACDSGLSCRSSFTGSSAGSSCSEQLSPVSSDDQLSWNKAEWFCGFASRDLVEDILCREIEGSFVVRQSSQSGCLALSVRVPFTHSSNGVSHYLILHTARGYKLKGFTKDFPSLHALLTHHSIMAEQLPCRLLFKRRQHHSSSSSSLSSQHVIRPSVGEIRPVVASPLKTDQNGDVKMPMWNTKSITSEPIYGFLGVPAFAKRVDVCK